MNPFLTQTIAVLLLIITLAFGFTPSAASAQTFPERFTGELNVCGKVAAAVKEGKSIESALLDVFLFYSKQPVSTYRSIQRGILYAAIQSCHYDAAEVVRAALRVDMDLSLLVLSMSESGINPQTLREILQQAGIQPTRIEEAIEVAAVEKYELTLDYTRVLPPPFAVSGGLGPASPFIP